MQSKALLGITVIALAGCQILGSAPNPGKEIIASLDPVSEDVLKRHVVTLSDDSFEGRAPGTPGGLKTRRYLAAEMQRLGLEPIGNSYESYELPVTLVSRSLDEEQSRARFNTPQGADKLSLETEAVFWSNRDENRLSVQGSDVVFVGHGVVAPEYGWNDYEGIDARGKTVVMLINDPGFRAQGKEFKGRAMTYYGRWTYKFEEAARQGADAAIIVHQTEPASYGWNVVAGSWAGAQLSLPRVEGSTEPVKVEAWITEEQAQAVFASAGIDFAEMEKASTTKGFKPIPLNGVSFSAEIYQTAEITESANVAGVLPGTERPDEYVLYTAHWDHIGYDQVRELEEGDGIYNGAVDNATGTGGILAIAETYVDAGVRPARSQIFLAVTAEESGLLGSKAFASNPPVPLNQIVGGLNVDGVLPTAPSKDMTVIGYNSSELEDVLRSVTKKKLNPDPSPEAGYFYRSDHIEFAKLGVPMLYVDIGTDLVEGGKAAGEAADAAYRANAYHAPGDEYDESWRFDGLVDHLTIMRDVGAVLSETEDWPNWYEGNEFRALRDAQMAGKDE